MERVNNMKKAVIAVLAAALIMAVTVAGTLAYMTAGEDGKSAVTNTFIAAGGGNLIGPGNPDDPPIIVEPDNTELMKGFYLVESTAEYNGNAYILTGVKTLRNSYDNVTRNMTTLPKNPELVVDIADGVAVYVFVKVTDTTEGNLSYTVDGDWKEVTGVTLGTGETLYCYSGAARTGGEGIDIRSSILRGNTVTVAENWNDIDNTEDGIQLGDLTFQAYICQAQGQGLDTPAKAFAACFLNQN